MLDWFQNFFTHTDCYHSGPTRRVDTSPDGSISTSINGSCPDSVAVVKKSSFFKLKKEREKREKKDIYYAIVCPKSQFLLCKTGPGLQMSCGSTGFQLDSRFPDRPTSWLQIGNNLLMESGPSQSNSRCGTCSKPVVTWRFPIIFPSATCELEQQFQFKSLWIWNHISEKVKHMPDS
jgi:hypothetical protein